MVSASTLAGGSRRRPMLQDESDASTSGRHRPPRPSTIGIQQSTMSFGRSRNRRRSSARFLQLHNRNNNGVLNEESEDSVDGEKEDSNSGNLQELYKKVIRMNAENKINASNSWSLRLIENIDTFLEENEEDEQSEDEQEQETVDVNKENGDVGNTSLVPKDRRVNFTKASCTLDASVKIYSYRVDDVHLTSYKVLANLHRNSNKDDKANKQDSNMDANGSNEETGEHEDKGTEKTSGNAPTLEQNIGNINLSKLDSAFDIDPLFSKMSKAFDEGGAKGLLLVNLGVSSNGCNIVFDSKAEADVDEEAQPDNDEIKEDEKMIDIANLIDKLKEQTSTDETRDMLAALEELPLVPQLSELRAEHAVLESQGFDVGGSAGETGADRKRGRYFNVSEEEEKEAERSIHQDALERSRASQGRPSFLGSEAEDEISYGDDNVFAGDNDDDDDFGGDGMFLNVTPQRPSSFSGNNSVIETDFVAQSHNQATSNFLDMLSNTHDFWLTNDDTHFFKQDVFALQGQNHWAGVSHWNAGKKHVASKTATKVKHTNAPRSERKTRKKPMVDFSNPSQEFKFDAGEGLTWSSTTVAKHGRNENVLPLDAGILSLKQLHSLFLRPTLVIQGKDHNRAKKAVGFADTDDWDNQNHGGGEGVFDDGDDDANDGPGFFMADNDEDAVTKDEDDFIFRELEGVRKVEKVHVGYATVAKKVDVKKLKSDLWNELEAKFATMKPDGDSDESNESDDEPMPDPPVLSFKKAVQTMESNKSQSDVTLPFYFICILHLANEKGLRLVDKGLDEFEIVHEGLKSSMNF